MSKKIKLILEILVMLIMSIAIIIVERYFVSNEIILIKSMDTSLDITKPIIYIESLEKDNIGIGWGRVDDVQSYIIYRKENGEGNYQEIALVESNQSYYKDTQIVTGKQYYYYIKAVSNMGNEDYCSDSILISSFVESVSNIREYVANGHLAIRWDRVNDCDRYYIYRQKEDSEEWEWINSVKYKEDAYYDFEIEPGVKYRYKIRSLVKNDYGNTYGESVASSWITSIPPTPVIEELSEDGTLSWIISDGANEYMIYESKDCKEWKYIDTTVKNKYTLTEPQKDYYYSIRSYYSDKDIYSNYAEGLQYNRILYNKKIFFDGDSIVFGKIQDGISAQVTYPDRVGIVLGSEIVNFAESGKSMAAAEHKQGENVSEQVEKGLMNYTGYDIICIGNGATDYNFNIPLGEENSMDIGTFNGAFNFVIKEIKRQNPTAKIVIITPTYRIYRRGTGADYGMYYENNVGLTQMDYCNELIKIAERNQCFLYNLDSTGIINQDNILIATMDGLHPIQEYYIKIGDSLAEFLREQVID